MTHHPEDLPYVRLRAMEPEDLELLYTIENDTQLWCVGTANVPVSYTHLTLPTILRV